MTDRRSYNDPCGIARALNLVGERWALLVVRELLLGPKRFTDLHNGLPTASQNVLSQRLRELEETGVVRRRRLGPPVSGQVYELTEWGRDLEPVLLNLGRWGSRAPLASTHNLSVDALVVGLRSMYQPALGGDLNTSITLRISGEEFRAEVADGQFTVVRGVAERPDAVLAADVATFTTLVFAGRTVADAVAAGELTVTGDSSAAARLLALFPLHSAA